MHNLNQLTVCRLATIYIGRIKDVETAWDEEVIEKSGVIKSGFAGSAWILLTHQGRFGSEVEHSIAICRLMQFPFELKSSEIETEEVLPGNDQTKIVAASWAQADSSSAVRVLSERISEYFRFCFQQRFFQSLEPIYEKGKLVSIKLIDARDFDSIRSIHNYCQQLEGQRFRRESKISATDLLANAMELPEEMKAEPECSVKSDSHQQLFAWNNIERRFRAGWCDVGIVAALPDEFTAIKEELALRMAEQGFGQPYFERGYWRGYYQASATGRIYSLALMEAGTYGSVRSAVVSAKMICELKPKEVVLCGYAAGRRPGGKGQVLCRECGESVSEENGDVANLDEGPLFGDLVVSTRILPYLYGKVVGMKRGRQRLKVELGNGVSARGAIFRTAQRLKRNQDLWKEVDRIPWPTCERCKQKPVRSGQRFPRVHLGVVASGSLVISAEDVVDWLEKQDRRVIGIEMEGEGIAEAAEEAAGEKTGFVVIKSIVDYADPRKNDEWHEEGARIAARFIFACLDKMGGV